MVQTLAQVSLYRFPFRRVKIDIQRVKSILTYLKKYLDIYSKKATVQRTKCGIIRLEAVDSSSVALTNRNTAMMSRVLLLTLNKSLFLSWWEKNLNPTFHSSYHFGNQMLNRHQKGKLKQKEREGMQSFYFSFYFFLTHRFN